MGTGRRTMPCSFVAWRWSTAEYMLFRSSYVDLAPLLQRLTTAATSGLVWPASHWRHPATDLNSPRSFWSMVSFSSFRFTLPLFISEMNFCWFRWISYSPVAGFCFRVICLPLNSKGLSKVNSFWLPHLNNWSKWFRSYLESCASKKSSTYTMATAQRTGCLQPSNFLCKKNSILSKEPCT